MFRIMLNGQMIPFESTKSQITYDEIEQLSEEPEPTVVIHYKNKGYETLEKGQSTNVENGMVINAVNTGGA